jgi:hypothetical protein
MRLCITVSISPFIHAKGRDTAKELMSVLDACT